MSFTHAHLRLIMIIEAREGCELRILKEGNVTVNYPYPDMDRERLAVIDNIERAHSEADSFRSVEPCDFVVDEAILSKMRGRFDFIRKSPTSKIKRRIAYWLMRECERQISAKTTVDGYENLLGIDGGFIIASNYFSYTDSGLFRHLLSKLSPVRELYILINEGELFKKGRLGFFMRNANTLPLFSGSEYTEKRLKAALLEIAAKGGAVLSHPEEQMWFNYKMPRPHGGKLYRLARELFLPVVPVFVELREDEGCDSLGFYPLRYSVHALPPVYPRESASVISDAERMCEEVYLSMLECYRSSYGLTGKEQFNPFLHIGGYRGE